MPNMPEPAPAADRPAIYEVRLSGQLGAQWQDWFAGLTVSPADGGETLVTGPVADQAALHGLLRKVRDLGLPLISVNRVSPKPAPQDEPAGEGHQKD
jgi:hypothetical protein